MFFRIPALAIMFSCGIAPCQMLVIRSDALTIWMPGSDQVIMQCDSMRQYALFVEPDGICDDCTLYRLVAEKQKKVIAEMAPSLALHDARGIICETVSTRQQVTAEGADLFAVWPERKRVVLANGDAGLLMQSVVNACGRCDIASAGNRLEIIQRWQEEGSDSLGTRRTVERHGPALRFTQWKIITVSYGDRERFLSGEGWTLRPGTYGFFWYVDAAKQKAGGPR
jgi:hypothetical protein